MAGSSEGSSFFEGMGGVCVCVWGGGGGGGGGGASIWSNLISI